MVLLARVRSYVTIVVKLEENRVASRGWWHGERCCVLLSAGTSARHRRLADASSPRSAARGTRRRHHHSAQPRLARKSGPQQVAAGLLYFIVCQGTMLAKEFQAIKKVPGFVNEVRTASAAGWCQAVITHALSCTQGPHCSFVAQQGWSTKYPALGCHKRAFALRDLVSSWSLSTCGRDVSSRRSILTADAPPSSARSSWHRRSN